MLPFLKNKKNKKVSLPYLLVFLFTAQIIVLTGVVWYFSFLNGQRAVNDVAHQLRGEIIAQIEAYLETYLEIPQQIIENNAISIPQILVGTNDLDNLQHLFLEQILIYDSVTSIYFGTPEGGIVGAGREGAEGNLYVFETEQYKKGTFEKYRVDSEGNHKNLLVEVPEFDTRSRPWYIKALRNGMFTWNDLYILSTGQDMAIAASQPVYDQDDNLLGVISLDIFLSHLSVFLKNLDISKSGQSFLMDRSGLLIASSTGEYLSPEINEGDELQRLYAYESSTLLIQHTAEFLTEKYGDFEHVGLEENLKFKIKGANHYAQILPIQNQYGIDWLIVVVIPESDFMEQIKKNNQVTFLVILTASLLSIFITIFTSRKIIFQVRLLNESTKSLTLGNWKSLISENFWISEFNELTTSFNRMAMQLKETVETLREEIVERKRAEEALKESAGQFRSTFEQAAVGIIHVDPNGRFLKVNQRFCEITGYDQEEMLKLTFQDITHPADLESDVNYTNQLLQNKSDTYSMEKRYINKGGETIWINLTVSLLRDPDDKPVYFISVIEDISQRKKAEESLIIERQRLSYILEGTNAGTWEWNVQTGETIFNPRWAEIIGYTLEEISPVSIDTWIKYTHPEDLELSNNIFDKHFNGDLDFYECRVRMKHKNGDWVWILDRGKVSSWTKDGKPLIVSGTHQDITQQVLAEIELEDHRLHLEELVNSRTKELAEEIQIRKKSEEDLRTAKETAEAANRTKSTFLSNMSHELRTPLNAILGFSQLMARDTSLLNKQQENLEIIIHSGEHLLSLINDILTLSKIEAGKESIETASFDLDKTLSNLKNLFALSASSNEISISVTKEQNIPKYIRTDHGKLRQILINLLNNAIKFTQNGSIDMRIKMGPNILSSGKIELLFEVEDTGIGIPETDLQNIFEAFVQSDNVLSKSEGTGLGLSISQQFVKLLGGELQVSSVVDQGSKFWFSIPVEVVHDNLAVDLKDNFIQNKVFTSKALGQNRQISELSLYLREIPSEWIQELKHAATTFNQTSIKVLIQKIRDYEAIDLANKLETLNKNFDYKTILEAIRLLNSENE
ncbi:MAG: PAS domain S-box protein [Anaerolineaceae bacterium]|nr:PAS domain S-box protein [Anaerolineaceae bacterium]